METKGENISVAVRIRPLQDLEISAGSQEAWECINEFTIKELNGNREFLYDRVYGKTSSTEDVFIDLAQEVIEKCIEGYNGCIFCYGQTGSGKTHTMHGYKKFPGLVPQGIESIFSIIQRSPKRDFLIRCSYIEIYNESVNDLLNPNLLNLQLAEDKKVGLI